MSKFRQTNSFAKRSEESLRVRNKFPGRIPIVVERASGDTSPDIDKCKYLVPCNLRISDFFHIIRKRLHLQPDEALFFFTENYASPCMQHFLSEVYRDNANEDGFLYLTYTAESAFGHL